MAKKIKWDRVEKVRRLANKHLSYREIAEILGVHFSTICRDFHRKRPVHKRGLQSVA